MRAVIITSNGYLDKRLERILINNGIKGDIETKITRNMLNVYDCVIFSYKNEIPNLPIVIERLVLEKKILVVYINNTASIGSFYNVIKDLFFININELTMEIELPLVIKSSLKYLKKITQLQSEKTTIEEQLNTLKLTNKAKQILISKGLSEAESHQFIQKKAMDLRVSKLKLVNLIIKNKIDI
jgi:response regulator NasT